MAPSGLAILIGAGPAAGAGIARILAHPAHGNLAVALLARNADNLNSLASKLRSETQGAIIETFPSDTSPGSLQKVFGEIRTQQSFKNLKLKVSIFSVKHASKKPFLEETYEDFTGGLDTYVGGAMCFAQETIKLLFEHQ